MAKQGQKLTDELKEIIKANLVLSDNKNEIAKKMNVSWATVDKVAKEMKDIPEEEEKFEKLREDKRQSFLNRLWENIEDAVELGHTMVKEAREGKRDIPLSNISTYVGTLYDKHALMTGGKTADVSITLTGEVKEWAK